MKRNRRVKRHSHFALNAMNIATLLITGVCMLMAYWWLDSRCVAIAHDIGKAEKSLAKLDSELERETMKWNEMKTPERLEAALSRHGLDMHNPGPDQVIKMRFDGHVAPRQMSVVRAQRRNRSAVSRTAQDSSSKRVRRVVR